MADSESVISLFQNEVKIGISRVASLLPERAARDVNIKISFWRMAERAWQGAGDLKAEFPPKMKSSIR